MEFDKNKILTVVTADQARVGQKGWFGDELCALMRMVGKCKPMTVRRIEPESHCRRFMTDQDIPFALFYPAQEPTYRPFANAEEFKPYRDEWVSHDTATRRIISYGCCGIIVSQPYGEGYGRFFSFETAFKELKFENGEPFGVKEEA